MNKKDELLKITKDEKNALLDYCTVYEFHVSNLLENDIEYELMQNLKGRYVRYNELSEILRVFKGVVSIIYKKIESVKKLDVYYKITELGKYTETEKAQINKMLVLIKELEKKETFQDNMQGDILYISIDKDVPVVKVSDVLLSTDKYNKKMEYILAPFTYIDEKEYKCNWWKYRNYNIKLKNQKYDENEFDKRLLDNDYIYEEAAKVNEILGKYKLLLDNLARAKEKLDFFENEPYYLDKKKDVDEQKDIVAGIEYEINDLKIIYSRIKNDLISRFKYEANIIKVNILDIINDTLGDYNEQKLRADIEQINELKDNILAGYENYNGKISNVEKNLKKCNSVSQQLNIDFKINADYNNISNYYEDIVKNSKENSLKINNSFENIDSMSVAEKLNFCKKVEKYKNALEFVNNNITGIQDFFSKAVNYFDEILMTKIDDKVNNFVVNIENNLIDEKIKEISSEKIGFFDKLFGKQKIKNAKIELYKAYKEAIVYGKDGITEPTLDKEKIYLKIDKIIKYNKNKQNINEILFFKEKYLKCIDVDMERVRKLQNNMYEQNVLNDNLPTKQNKKEILSAINMQIKKINEEIEKSKDKFANEKQKKIDERIKYEKVVNKINQNKSMLYEMNEKTK